MKYQLESPVVKDLSPARRSWLWGAIGVLAGLVLVLLVYAIYYAGDKATDAADATDSSAELTAVIRDCVEPGGTCYKRARAQRLKVSEETRQIAIYTAVCSRRLSPYDSDKVAARKIGRCVNRLREDQPLT